MSTMTGTSSDSKLSRSSTIDVAGDLEEFRSIESIIARRHLGKPTGEPQQRPGYDLMKNLKWMRQIADALAYLHSRNTVHRDLKPENVLLTDQVNEDIKLADFGLARKYIALRQANTELNDAQYYMQTGVGTLHYMAPEVFAGHYTEKSDVFSLGVLFYAIVERRFAQFPDGKRMYGAFVSTLTNGMVGLGFAMANINGYQNSMVTFTQASASVQQLIKNVLSPYYHQRMSASDVRAQL